MLLSVRPQYAAKLISGEKTAELRRVRPSLRPPFKALVYATAPLACVIGSIEILDVACGDRESIWRDYGPALCVPLDEYIAYTANGGTLCCWTVGRPLAFPAPLALGGEPPPRSFRYLDGRHALVVGGMA